MYSYNVSKKKLNTNKTSDEISTAHLLYYPVVFVQCKCNSFPRQKVSNKLFVPIMHLYTQSVVPLVEREFRVPSKSGCHKNKVTSLQ